MTRTDPPADATRRRRTADEARAAILAAAETLLAQGGPANLRLQEVAQRAGMSHPTVLHHFGSREGLVDALNHKASTEIAQMLESFVEMPDTRPDLVGQVFEKLRSGHAQRLAWLAMTASGQPAIADRAPLVTRIVDAIHALRTRAAHRDGRPAPTRADTAFVVHLVLVTAVGEIVVGDALRPADDSPAERARRQADFVARFRQFVIGR